MKNFILAALTASILATPAMAAPQPQHRSSTVVRHQPGKTVVVKRDTYRAPQYRNFRKGERFDSRYARNYRQINDWRAYRGRHLYAPPRGYHWVRSGNDAVLVAVAGGLIGAVLSGAFN